MQPLSIIFPVLYALFLWWFTTGLIIVVYDRARWITRLCFAGATLALLIALGMLVLTRHNLTTTTVYIAVTCGVMVWGWQVAGYYLGFITGKPYPLDANRSHMAQRFRLALDSSLHHELLAVAFALLLAVITWDTPNSWGLWIYLTLWLMHTSAKLNVFLGVRNFRIDFLPRHLHHLDALLTKRSHNPFFPVSIVIASSITLWMTYRAVTSSVEPAQTVGFLLVATMMALGVFEHWLLVLPIPSTLYGWGMRAVPEQHQHPPTSHNTRQRDTGQQALATQPIKGETP